MSKEAASFCAYSIQLLINTRLSIANKTGFNACEI